MKKYLLFGCALFSSFGFSQQGFGEIIINTTNNQITSRTWDVANGSSPTNVDGPKWIGSSYCNTGTILIFMNDILFEPTNWSFGTNSTINDETIGNGLASYINPTQLTNWGNFKNQNNSLNTIPITMISKEHTGTINGIPSTSPIEILRQEYILSNINSLPDGTWIFIGSRCASIMPSGNWNGFDIGTKKVNGIWTLPTVDPWGGAINQSSNGINITFSYTTDQQLSTYEIDNSNNKISIYPNPTKNFITIQNKENSTENFDYKIVDLTGRIVKSGKSKFDEQINIEDLTSGNYVVQIQTDNNQNFIQKLIKN